ncbi:hypothetical protein LJR231_006110 [Phyllobacterium sp. LjRoot231]|uniref:hypothetical protein n=1 Tax=Phyllobacterium sp. LjRoot231 TaxID=3342289 RepID=UPI003ECE6D12
MSGALLHRVDIFIDAGTKVSLKLKQERDTGQKYIVLDVKTADGGSSAIRAYEIGEFLLIAERLSHAIKEMSEKVQP